MALRRILGVERGAGLRRQQPLGMRGAVMGGHVAVLGLDQHLAVPVDEDGAERMVAMRHGAARDLEGPAQEVLVELRRAER